jgi:hypothetical protein
MGVDREPAAGTVQDAAQYADVLAVTKALDPTEPAA